MALLYARLNSSDYTHLAVNHSENFVDPSSGSHLYIEAIATELVSDNETYFSL